MKGEYNMSTIRDIFGDIADAIRTCNGSLDTYTPAQMPNAIRELLNSSSGLTTVEPASVWKNGTNDDVLIMVNLADAGLIDLTDYWSVGDTRSVSISAMSATGVGESQSAQTVEMVLMHANPSKYTYVTTPISGRTKPFFIYGQKNSLATKGYMNSSNTNTGSWDGCKRRTWCNNVYREAVPSYLKTITKQVNVITAQTYNGSTNQTSQDYFFLAAAKEVYGGNATTAGRDTKFSNLTEFQALEQWTWYKTADNRIKTRSGSAADWWERSPYYSNSTSFCYVFSDGSANNYNAYSTRGLAPCGSI